MNYQITDNQTGQKFSVNWQGDKPPTDAEMSEIQSKVAASSTTPAAKPQIQGNYLTNTVLPDVAANLQALNPIELLKKGYAYGQKLTDVGNAAENEVSKIAPAVNAPAPSNNNFEVKTNTDTAQGKPAPVSPSMAVIGTIIKDAGDMAKGTMDFATSPKSWLQHPVSAALMAAPMLGDIKLVGRATMPEALSGAAKIAEEVPGQTMSNAGVLAGKSLQPNTLRTIASDPEFAKMVGPQTASHIPTVFEPKAVASLKDAYSGLHKAQNQFYKGITNDAAVDLAQVVKNEQGEVAKTSPLVRLQNTVNDFKDGALKDEKGVVIGDDAKALEEAQGVLNNINAGNKNGVITFGQSKQIANKIADLVEKYQRDNGGATTASRMFGDMGSAIADAKNSIPEIANASPKFKDLMKAKDLIETNFPRLRTNPDSPFIDKSLFRRYKDEGNVSFKQNLDNASAILSKYPESQELSGFTQSMNRLNAAVDLEKAKPFQANIPFLNKLPVVGKYANVKVNPTTAATYLGKGIKNRFINPEAVISGLSKESTNPFFGDSLNRSRALKAILQNPWGKK